MEISLNRLPAGARAEVIRVNTDMAVTKKLRAFGLVPGTKIRCTYRCPWGDVTALEFRGSVLALRSDDLRKITVKVDGR